jgi:NAD kinase
MSIAERKAGILDLVQQVEDEQVLRMVEALLEVHLSEEKAEEVDILVFNPRDHHSKEDIARFEATDDFIGYGIDGTPLYGRGEAKKADLAIAGMLNGTIKGITHEEHKKKVEAKFEAWRRRTK